MKTRRNFVKGLFGLGGGILAAVGLRAFGETKKSKSSFFDFNTTEERIAFEAGMIAAIQAGKGPRPTLGWPCFVETEADDPNPLRGKIRVIDFKNRTITVCTNLKGKKWQQTKTQHLPSVP